MTKEIDIHCSSIIKDAKEIIKRKNTTFYSINKIVNFYNIFWLKLEYTNNVAQKEKEILAPSEVIVSLYIKIVFNTIKLSCLFYII